VQVLSVAQNSVERLNHGWFVVKNRSTQEIKDDVTFKQRNINERKFFQSPHWSAISKDRIGIEPLKSFLGQLLLNHIRKEFPQVVSEIENLVNTTEKQLERYGPPRQSSPEQRRYLTRLAMLYQKQSQ
jgi:hypothetical protein